MSELVQIGEEEATDPVVIMFADKDGKESLFAINMIIEHDDKRFALLSEVEMVDDLTVPIDGPDMFVARIDTDENNAEMYSDPTDEEFAAVIAIVEEYKEEPVQE